MDGQPELKKYVPGLVWYRPFEPYAYAFIRFSTGLVLALHGVQRLFYGAATAELGATLSRLPASLVGVVEIAGGALLALGLLTRPIALLFALEWLAVALAAHAPPGRSWFMLGTTEHIPALVVALCIAFILRGGGRHSLDRRLGKEFPIVPALAGLYRRGAPLSYAFIRIVMGLLMLVPGIDKMFYGGAARIAAGNLVRLGVQPPMVWAWTVAGLEFFGGILLILGLFTRPVAFALAVELTVITTGILAPRGWLWTVNGVEVGLLVTLVLIGLVLGGSGRYSLDRKIGREF
jgi:putative oxidoreductase